MPSCRVRDNSAGEGAFTDSKCNTNPVQHIIYLFVHFDVPETQHPKALTRQKRGSRFVVRGIPWQGMLIAIEFDNQFLFEANEISDKRSERLLATKLEFAQTSVAQRIPKLLFGLRLLTPKTAGEIVLQCHPSPGSCRWRAWQSVRY